MIICIEQGIKYTRRNGTVNYARTHLVKSSSEINMLKNSKNNSLGLFYTTLLINYHHQTQGDNTGSRSTVNLSFRKLLPKITKIKRIQQGKNNEVRWKDSRY